MERGGETLGQVSWATPPEAVDGVTCGGISVSSMWDEGSTSSVNVKVTVTLNGFFFFLIKSCASSVWSECIGDQLVTLHNPLLDHTAGYEQMFPAWLQPLVLG